MTAAQKRRRVVDSYLGRKGRNSYTQGDKRKYFYGYPTDGKAGYSDCSSSWREAYLRELGIDIGGNTAAQIVNKSLIEVCLQTKGQPDMSKLELGDLLYFRGNPAHPFGVQHVEGYIGNGQVAGHGSGTGPRVTNCKTYCADRYAKGRGLIKVLRVVPSDGATAPTPNTTPNYPLGFGARMLRYGNSGPDVANLQRALISLKYSLGEWGADGDFGSITKGVVMAYQKSRKLEIDGIVGPKTVAALVKDVPVEGDADGEAADTRQRVTIQGGDAYIRTQPNTTAAAKIIGLARNGTTWPYLGEVSPGNWLAVDMDGERGWISGLYAKL